MAYSIMNDVGTAERRPLRHKLVRVFAIQIGLISIAIAAGIYVTNTIVQDSLIRQALEAEAAHFWTLYVADAEQPLPNTSNMRGFIARADAPADLPPAVASLGPGLHRVEGVDAGPIMHVSERGGVKLYLAFASDQVSDLAFWFGILPLSIGLLVIYGLTFVAYRLSRRALSPVQRLADYLEHFDFTQSHSFDVDLEPLKLGADLEVRQMVDALERFAQRLDTFVEREKTFTRDASHELRTPLAVFKGSLDLLEHPGAEACTSMDLDRNALRMMRRTVNDMEGLIETLLVLAREDELALPSEPILVNDLVARYVDALAPLARESGNTIRLHEDDALSIRVPERVFQMLVQNLLRNAISYTKEGTVEVCIDSDRLTVSDSGVGMTPEELDNAFKPFYRAESGRPMASGHGLGLAIVRRFARQFGWRISAHSRPDEGTRVEVVFARNGVRDSVANLPLPDAG